MSIKIHNPSTIDVKDSYSLGTYHLADNPALYEVQRENNFEFVINFRPNETLTTASVGGAESFTGSEALEVLRMSVVSCDIPTFSQDPITIRRGNNMLKYAGVPTFGSGNLVVRDFIGADSKGILSAWQSKSYNVKTEKVGLVEDYKRNCTLLELTPDHQVVRSWIMKGCWISRLDYGSYNAENNGAKTISATIEYDSAILDYNKDLSDF